MIDIIKENISINKIIGSKNFQIDVEGDTIIPDAKPDILSAISSTGNVCIYKKEILEGKIRLDGNVNIYLMYLADGEGQNTRGFSTNIDFTEILDFPGVENKMTLDENISIKKIECKVLNGRKVNFKITLEVEAKIFLNENEEMVKEVKGIDDMQSQISSLKMNTLIGQNMTKAIAKETLIVENTDNIQEILMTDIKIINKDMKISYNKVLAKADIRIKIAYLTEDRKCQENRRNTANNGIYRPSWNSRRRLM